MDSTIKEDIEKANMDIQSLNLLTRKCSDDADCLFIDSPSTDISEDEKAAIIDYLENGGKAMIFSDYTTETCQTLMQFWKTMVFREKLESYLKVIISIMQCRCHIIWFRL
ncbi:MAG: Gldg family protein [Streptococcus sp.]